MLALERLSHCIQDRVENDSWKPYVFGIGGPKLSHISFADDLALVVEVNSSRVGIIKIFRDEFCDRSGKKINFSKSKVYFSKNISSEVAANLSQ